MTVCSNDSCLCDVRDYSSITSIEENGTEKLEYVDFTKYRTLISVRGGLGKKTSLKIIYVSQRLEGSFSSLSN